MIHQKNRFVASCFIAPCFIAPCFIALCFVVAWFASGKATAQPPGKTTPAAKNTPAKKSVKNSAENSAENSAATVQPLVRAHAHNDYLHERPLLDALDQGFCSVEADVYLVNGELLVAHDPWELKTQRSLKSLYLDPLRKRVAANGGRVYRDGPPVTLLIDIKSDAKSTFLALHQLLLQYDDILTTVTDGNVTTKAVIAIISGNRDNQTILSQSPRMAGIDGRLSDLSSDLPVDQLPLISDHWMNHFRWRGDGKMDPAETAKLKQTVDQVHAKGRRIRFWATPDKPAVWKVLNDAGVDLINTDKLAELSMFLKQSSISPDQN